MRSAFGRVPRNESCKAEIRPQLLADATKIIDAKERDRVRTLQPGEAYSNATDSVEWIVPRKVMSQLVIANEGL